MNFFKKHITLIIGIAAAIAVLCTALYVRQRIVGFKNRGGNQELAREPKLDADSKKQEYDVANVTTSEIFFGSRVAGSDGADTAPLALPQGGVAAVSDTAGEVSAEAKKGAKKNSIAGGTSAGAAKQIASSPPTVSAANAGGQVSLGSSGALEEMERREQAAAAAARREANAKVEEERRMREEAERRAAALEEANRKPTFNFVVVESRYHRSEQQQDKHTRSQEKELLYTAKIYGTQRVKTGDPLTLRNTEPVPFGSRIIPAASILYGIASQNGNRMHITLTSAVTREGKYAISLSIYDHDMVRGIYLKDYEDVAQESAAESTIDEIGSAVPNRLIGSVTKATSKQVQRNLTKQQKLVITLEDEYEVYIAVPQK
jgi:hypothetical protein